MVYSKTTCIFTEAVLRLAFFLAKLWDRAKVWHWNAFESIFKAITQKRSFLKWYLKHSVSGINSNTKGLNTVPMKKRHGHQ